MLLVNFRSSGDLYVGFSFGRSYITRGGGGGGGDECKQNITELQLSSIVFIKKSTK